MPSVKVIAGKVDFNSETEEHVGLARGNIKIDYKAHEAPLQLPTEHVFANVKLYKERLKQKATDAVFQAELQRHSNRLFKPEGISK